LVKQERPQVVITIFAVFWSELERGETDRKMSPKMSEMSLGKKLTHQVFFKKRLTTAKIEVIFEGVS